MAIRLVLADDHPVFLSGLQALLSAEPDIEVLAACASGHEALAAVRRHHPDVLVLDLAMPGKDGLSVVLEMSAEPALRSTKVVLLTAELDDEQILRAIELGVRGTVLKEMAPSVILSCLREVAAGRQWLERFTTTRALDQLLKRQAARKSVAAVLTEREVELVKFVATGLSSKEISERLSISEHTVKAHLSNIYQKLNVKNRVGLTLYAQENGVV